MPLTETEKILLHEVYECAQPGTGNVIVSSGGGVATSPYFLSSVTPVQEKLQKAIEFIDGDEDRVARVSEILTEYAGYSLDPSPIDREGYSFRASRNLKAARKALYPMTGILWNDGYSNVMARG